MHSQHFTLSDSTWHEVLRLAGERKVPVNLHVTDPASRPYPGRVETPLADFARLARAWPQVSFVLAHWGGLLPLVDADALTPDDGWNFAPLAPIVNCNTP